VTRVLHRQFRRLAETDRRFKSQMKRVETDEEIRFYLCRLLAGNTDGHIRQQKIFRVLKKKNQETRNGKKKKNTRSEIEIILEILNITHIEYYALQWHKTTSM
jgi:predicted aldo/keto reductase-like oxidoreductase